MVDGELAVLGDDGRPDFRAILSRENASPAKVAAAARRHPVVYVVFDILYAGYQSMMALPLLERRERLQQLVQAMAQPRLMFSDGVVGDGMQLFAAATERELEGIVQKRLDSPYLPGERTDAWRKCKRVQSIHCLVLGYEPDGERDFKSLIVATDIDGELRCVGKVGSGIGQAEREQLRELLFARTAAAPLIEVDLPGAWVEPGIYCTVSFLERTTAGNLRAPVFRGLVS